MTRARRRAAGLGLVGGLGVADAAMTALAHNKRIKLTKSTTDGPAAAFAAYPRRWGRQRMTS